MAKKSSTPAAAEPHWSQDVTEHSDAMDLAPDVFKLHDPAEIARSLKASAEDSDRRKSNPYRSAMSMLTFYINRAGHNLDPAQRARLEKAKDELRALFGEAPASGPAAKKAPRGNRGAKRAPSSTEVIGASATTAAAKKATAKKATAKKATAKKATAKKEAPTKGSAGELAAKKTATRKATTKKATAGKTTTKKATAKKATAKNATAKTATAKKATAKTAGAR